MPTVPSSFLSPERLPFCRESGDKPRPSYCLTLPWCQGGCRSSPHVASASPLVLEGEVILESVTTSLALYVSRTLTQAEASAVEGLPKVAQEVS